LNKVAAQLRNESSFVTNIYSLDPVTVFLNRPEQAIGTNAPLGDTTLAYTKTVTNVSVLLSVFDKEVQADGFQANITFVVNSQEQFGVYVLTVSNVIGVTSHSIEFFPEGLHLTVFRLDLFLCFKCFVMHHYLCKITLYLLHCFPKKARKLMLQHFYRSAKSSRHHRY